MEEKVPLTHIKDYVVTCRQRGITDSKITETLTKANWPDDVIQMAVSEPNNIEGSVPEPEIPVNPPQPVQEEGKDQKPGEDKPKEEESLKQEEPVKKDVEETKINNNEVLKVHETQSVSEPQNSEGILKEPNSEPRIDEKPEEKKEQVKKQKSDLFTKPPKEVSKEEPKKEEPSKPKEKKTFSGLVIVALLLSPIPFVGLGVSMATMESIKHHNKKGMFLAVLALLINVFVILGIIYLMFQIFSLEPDNLTGFSKYINDNLNLV